MKVQRFDDPQRFQDIVQKYLIKNEAENNLPLGVLNGVISGEYQSPYLAYVEENGHPVLVMLCTPPHPVIFSYQDPIPSDDVLEMALLDMEDHIGDSLSGFTGNKKLMTKMNAITEKVIGKKTDQHMAMRIYKLAEVVLLPDVAGSISPAEKKDRKVIMEWLTGFYREAAQNPADPAQIRKQVDLYLNSDPIQRGLLIWVKQGIPVSMAGYAGPTPNGIRVGAVYTPPEQRKKGYASAVTAGVSQRLLDFGYKFCFLFTDLLNPTSNHIYQEIGYRPVCDVDRYTFK